jgi:hypothetical protein
MRWIEEPDPNERAEKHRAVSHARPDFEIFATAPRWVARGMWYVACQSKQ